MQHHGRILLSRDPKRTRALSPGLSVNLHRHLFAWFDDDGYLAALAQPLCITETNTNLTQMKGSLNGNYIQDSILTTARHIASHDSVQLLFVCNGQTSRIQVVHAIRSIQTCNNRIPLVNRTVNANG